MQDRKAVRPRSKGQQPARPEVAPDQHRPEATMHMDAPVRKAGGRLSREDQRRLGDILQRVYDDVVRQGVPDRFKDLLNELDGGAGGQGSGGESVQKPPEEKTAAQGDERASDRLVEAKGSETTQHKGTS